MLACRLRQPRSPGRPSSKYVGLAHQGELLLSLLWLPRRYRPPVKWLLKTALVYGGVMRVAAIGRANCTASGAGPAPVIGCFTHGKERPLPTGNETACATSADSAVATATAAKTPREAAGPGYLRPPGCRRGLPTGGAATCGGGSCEPAPIRDAAAEIEVDAVTARGGTVHGSRTLIPTLGSDDGYHKGAGSASLSRTIDTPGRSGHYVAPACRVPVCAA